MDTISVKNSAIGIVYHTYSIPNVFGMKYIKIDVKIKPLRVDIIIERLASAIAVNMLEVNMLYPLIRNAIAYIDAPLTAISSMCLLSPEKNNSMIEGLNRVSIIAINTPIPPIIVAENL